MRELLSLTVWVPKPKEMCETQFLKLALLLNDGKNILMI